METNSLQQAMRDPGPHTVDSLAARLPHFPREAIRQALELLTAQGVLERVSDESGEAYRYVDPARYAQAGMDVVVNPAGPPSRR